MRRSGSSRCHRLVKEVEQGLDPAWMCQLSTELWDQAPNLFLEPQSQGNFDLNHHICTASVCSERLCVIVQQGKMGQLKGQKKQLGVSLVLSIKCRVSGMCWAVPVDGE